MKHYLIGLTLERLGITEYVIRGDIESEQDFLDNTEFEGTVTNIISEYNITVAQFDLEELRQARNKKLEATDWWELPSQLPMSSDRESYRQALRDITDTYTSLEDVVWPEKPE